MHQQISHLEAQIKQKDLEARDSNKHVKAL